VGTTSTISVKLTNTGAANLNVTGISNSGANPTDFGHTSNCGGTAIAPGAYCTLQVTFTPASAASFTANMLISDNVPGSPQQISLSGTGVAGPAVSLSATSLSFPSTNVGTTSTLSVKLTNTGSANLNVTGISNSGANPTDFGHTSNCGGTAIAPGSYCTLQVTFTPASAASFNANLLITDNAPGSPQSISLSGTGVAGPAVSLSTTALSFPSTNVGTTSTLSVKLTNTGAANLNVTGIGNSGANPTDFGHTSNCGGTPIAPGAFCTLQVTFTPASAASFTANLLITDNAPGSPQAISLSGTGVSGPAVSLSTTSLNFPATTAGSTSTLSVTLTNSGAANLNVTGIGNSGANPTDFGHTSNCGGTPIAPGGFCTVQVTFTPASAGSFSANLLITDNAPGSPQTITLSGTGQ
jgi:hypothetical protein